VAGVLEIVVTSAPVSSLNEVSLPLSKMVENQAVVCPLVTESKNAVSSVPPSWRFATDLERHCAL